MLLPCLILLATALAAADESKPIFFNQDATEFFVGTFGPNEPATLDRYVASFRGTGVTDLVINVNAQKTNYRSRVWDADWEGYDPAQGPGQPFFAGLRPGQEADQKWFRNSYAFHALGVDYPAYMLKASWRNGIRAWLSIRMNDAHFHDQPEHPYHSRFWRAHPEWRLPNGSLDYSQSAVRDHYLALVKEVCERLDLDGLELDFLRHGFYFPRQHTVEAIRQMTEFMRQVRRLVQQAAHRRKRPIPLMVRVPTRPWTSRQRGLDAVAWARERLVDVVVLAPWWASTQSDVPLETWRGLLSGTGVRVMGSVEDGITSGSLPRRTITVEEARGIALSFLDRGADGTYLFNLFTDPLRTWKPEEYRRLLADAGSIRRLAERPVRHPVTLVDPWEPGETIPARPFANAGEQAMLRIPTGPKPAASADVTVIIGTAGERPEWVRMNGAPCVYLSTDGLLHTYKSSAEAVTRGYNAVEVRLPKGGRLTWAEIAVRP